MTHFFRLIVLSFLLAGGFLLSILSCALYNSWWPLFVIFTYIFAPLPNMICSRFQSDEIIGDEPSIMTDVGNFLTSIFIISGFGFSVVFFHAEMITQAAMIMSIIGGLMVYGTILAYSYLFSQSDELE